MRSLFKSDEELLRFAEMGDVDALAELGAKCPKSLTSKPIKLNMNEIIHKISKKLLIKIIKKIITDNTDLTFGTVDYKGIAEDVINYIK